MSTDSNLWKMEAGIWWEPWGWKAGGWDIFWGLAVRFVGDGGDVVRGMGSM